MAIGKCDGLHIGHGKLLDQILAQKKNGLKACVFTFDPAPAVFFGRADRKELTVKEEKRALLKQLGVDILIEFPMTEQTASMAPEVFVEQVLVKGLQMRYIAAGTDLAFGAGGAGNADLLQKLAEKFGYQTQLIHKVCLDDMEVSSTGIRKVLETGEMEKVNQLLGRPYPVFGEVVHGKKLGRTVGMPTVNILPSQDKLMPPCGVYASRICYQGKEYGGISNVGYKPTVTEERILGVETHIFDFAEDTYGQWLEVSLVRFRRPERRFESLEALRRQVEEDILWAKTVL